MPVLAPAIGAAVTFFSTPIGSLVLLGVVAGVSSLVNGGAAGGSTASSASNGAQLSLQRGEDYVLDAIVGRFATGGQLVFHYELGDDNEYLNLAIVLGTGLHDSLEHLYVDGERKTLVGSNSDTYGRTVSEYTVSGDPHMWVKFFNGSKDQTADATMVSEVGDTSRWSTAHRLRGHAWAWVRLKYDEELFSGGEPSFVFQLKGLRLYDWRKDSTVAGGSGAHRWGNETTYEWTQNPSVVLYNYKRGIYVGTVRVFGAGALAADLNLAKFTAAANLSDESVVYPDTSVTIPRYHIGLQLTDDTDPQDFVRTCEEAMGGYGAAPGGLYGPLPACTKSSVMTITDADLQQGYSRTYQTRLSPVDTYNRVQGKFSDPSKSWQLAPYGTRKDAAVEVAQGGARTLSLDLGYLNVYEGAQAVAEIRRRRDLYQMSESAVFRPKFAPLQPGDTITRITPVFGTVSMDVMSREELEDGSVSLTLRQWSNSIVPNSGDAYVPAPPSPAPPAPTPSLLLTVPGFDADPIQQTDGTSSVPAIKATWTSITDQAVDRVVVRYYPSAVGIGDALYASVPRGSGASVVLSGVAPNTEYVVQAKLETTPIRPGLTYTAPITVTTGAVETEASVPPITPSMLGTQLLNERGFVVGAGPGTLSEILDDLYGDVDQLASAVTTNTMVTNLLRTRVQARFEQSIAAVLTESQTRASADSALATQITEVLASVDEVIADGFLRFESIVDGGGALATITAKVKASAGATFSQAAWILRAEADGLGGSNAYFGVLGTFYVFDAVDATPVPVFGVDGGVAKFHRLESFANVSGTPIVILDGDTGAFSITVP